MSRNQKSFCSNTFRNCYVFNLGINLSDILPVYQKKGITDRYFYQWIEIRIKMTLCPNVSMCHIPTECHFDPDFDPLVEVSVC